MPEAVIVATARTPIGRARKGTLIGIDAFQLAEVAIGGALGRSGLPVADIDDLILAESYQGGGVIGRNVAVRLGLTTVPGVATNRHCASGLGAIAFGAGEHPRRYGSGRARWRDREPEQPGDGREDERRGPEAMDVGAQPEHP